ncbi:hypothetical protein AVEN_175344-1 [Araneus ventricosus]|uniref:Uncharacterized protein n=1 Tax=Araneus ventricosus TaxID=182803 RepID=A0A4Y2TGT0_ARAVE|nr:hypothetical protein AVEN_175344-1 [Araneus ventricosus]
MECLDSRHTFNIQKMAELLGAFQLAAKTNSPLLSRKDFTFSALAKNMYVFSSLKKPALFTKRKSRDFPHAADLSSCSNPQNLTSFTELLEPSTSFVQARL